MDKYKRIFEFLNRFKANTPNSQKNDNFGELNPDEIERLFRQIEGTEENEIDKIISNELSNYKSNLICFRDCITEGDYLDLEGEGKNKGTDEDKDVLFHSCKCEIRKKSEEIRKIMKDNTNTTNYILEIVQLIAPAVAQVYLGMSGLAIVGAITILCKQGIQQMIE